MLSWLQTQPRDTTLAVRYVIIADPDLLAERAQMLGLPYDLPHYNSAHAQPISVLPITMPAPCVAGELNKSNAHYVIHTLLRAIDGCRQQEFSALVTGPVHKGIINQAGIDFSGHTELLAEQTEAALPLMMLATAELRVLLATTHLPLRAVPDAITQKLVVDITRIAHQDLERYFGVTAPHIMVCGLNPHAGEGGHLGQEEITDIIPAIEQLQSEGINATGPWPADTAFAKHHLASADAVLAMYHDQGLPVLKHQGFGSAANITLGLPIIRTSVDHGTALDLAGGGNANIGSLQTAIEQATLMLRHI